MTRNIGSARSGRSLPWFRMYVDFLNDPKMIALAFEDQRHFIGILALKSDGALDEDVAPELLDRIVAQRLWIDRAVIADVKKRLVAIGLIDDDWQPLAWNRRQMKSDADSTAAERKRRQRERERINSNNQLDDVTDMSRVTVTNVTRLDTDTDTDEDTKLKLSSPQPRLPDCPHQKLIALYRQHLPHLAQPRVWTGSRATNMRQRWVQASKPSAYCKTGYQTEAEGLQFWGEFFAHVATGTTLPRGFTSGDRTWLPDLPWIVKAENFAKIVDGRYNR